MKLLFCLVILVAELWALEPSKRIRNRTEERRLASRALLAKLSKQTVESLQQNFKDVNWEERNIRLAALGEGQVEEMKKRTDSRLQGIISRIKPICVQRPPNVNTSDLFEVNQMTGVSNVMYQGDIMLTDEQLSAMERLSSNSNGREKRQASTVFPIWTNNRVFYFMDETISPRKRAVIAEAIKLLEEQTCIRFTESSTNPSRIRVFSGPGCFATLGMRQREQELSLGNGCEVIGTVIHEFAHSLGIWHTQMRSDRDDFVSIDLSAVQRGLENNFLKLPANQERAYTLYEYGSVMHYQANAFATNGRLSVVPRDDKYVYTMGNRMVSFYDIMIINEHYGCSARCPAATSARCQNDGVPNPNNCAVCNCPSGYGGALCDQRPTGCGEELTATTSFQSKRFEFGGPGERDIFTMCNFWIRAPAGRKIEVRVTNMINSQCQHACPFQGIEFKTETDKRMTNPRVCCPEFNNNIFTSELNPMPVVAWNRFLTTTFTFEYRHVASNGTNPAPVDQTTRRPVGPNCVDRQAICSQLSNAGFCSNPAQTFEVRKFNCARTCGLCGQAATPCRDRGGPRCVTLRNNGFCTRDALIAELQCASTCGYCRNPN